MTDHRKVDRPSPLDEIPEPDASERLLQAEGTDVAQRPMRPRRQHRARRSESFRETPPRVAGVGRFGDRSSPPESASDPDVATRIRELEDRIDRMIAATRTVGADAGAQDQEGSSDDVDEPRPAALAATAMEGAMGTARELLSSDFYLRQSARLGLRSRPEDGDEFGYDRAYENRVLPLIDFLYERYFRVVTSGIERVPNEGRCLLVANHAGTLPVDGIMLRRAIHREHARHRELRWLAEDAVFHFPFLGTFTNRLGAVRACQENAERLLDRGALVAVFPEGMKGVSKLFKQRYKLQRFGRGGFVKLALRTRTPVLPVAVIGGEETTPMIARIEYLTSILGVPYLPVTPTFPLLGPLGLLPAPTKWKMYFGAPIDFAQYGGESAEDEILVGRLTEQVRGEIQAMLDRGLAERRSVWFG